MELINITIPSQSLESVSVGDELLNDLYHLFELDGEFSGVCLS